MQAVICGGKGSDNIQAVHANVAGPAYDINMFLNPSGTSIQAAMCAGKGLDNIQAVHANVAGPAYHIDVGPPV
ncbi:hypothetical protein PAXRUDRAFT_22361 [Paxillus rubicundulus Ve08.2h10]|uniref:Uncharacterized protein n=1 Tax=Paxillus rubicundulus Ve08.2h10 TaxID=930991 RepID=A0A0D0CN95_9AGAM|nr:hypothetical protein PAXRUDRAFT_22361 [Paxillus rubicundulus Ve08.2h10]